MMEINKTEEESDPLMEENSDAQARQQSIDKKFTTLFIIAQIFGVLSVGFVIIWISKTLGGIGFSNSSVVFNFHPFFMVLGMVFLYGNGILIYRFMRYQAKSFLKIMHAVLNGMAFVLAVLALWAVFYFHNENNIPNMYSLHSWIGLLTVILFGSQFLLGFLTYLFPGGPDQLRKLLLPYHVFMGVFIFAMSVASSLTGITEKAFFSLNTPERRDKNESYSNLPSDAYVLNFLGIFIVLFFLFVYYLVSQITYKRKPLPADNPRNSTPLR